MSTATKELLDYEQIKHSCQWIPGESHKWIAIGYADGIKVFTNATDSDLAYNLDHYTQRAALTYASYEQGVAQAIASIARERTS
jgi:hypothetical protein